MQATEVRHITKTPGVCGGKACVLWHETRGYSPDEIVEIFPGITLADVHAALAYYFDHRQEIEADFKHDQELAESLRPHFPSKLQEKLRG